MNWSTWWDYSLNWSKYSYLAFDSLYYDKSYNETGIGKKYSNIRICIKVPLNPIKIIWTLRSVIKWLINY